MPLLKSSRVLKKAKVLKNTSDKDTDNKIDVNIVRMKRSRSTPVFQLHAPQCIVEVHRKRLEEIRKNDNPIN